MQLSYEFGRGRQTKSWDDGLRLTVGCNNLTDNIAPLIAGGPMITPTRTSMIFWVALFTFKFPIILIARFHLGVIALHYNFPVNTKIGGVRRGAGRYFSSGLGSRRWDGCGTWAATIERMAAIWEITSCLAPSRAPSSSDFLSGFEARLTYPHFH